MAMPVKRPKSAKPAPADGRSKEEQLLDHARQLATAGDPDWIELHNAIFGIGGRFSQLFTTAPERERFFKTPECKEITGMIEERQVGNSAEEIFKNVNGRLLVRVPRSIHAALLAEADAEGISLNQLCLAKLCVQLRSAARAAG
ncbi:MAG: toxin-antitoxin system HicB family antitoxin [Gemmataceae bacterium]